MRGVSSPRIGCIGGLCNTAMLYPSGGKSNLNCRYPGGEKAQETRSRALLCAGKSDQNPGDRKQSCLSAVERACIRPQWSFLGPRSWTMPSNRVTLEEKNRTELLNLMLPRGKCFSWRSSRDSHPSSSCKRWPGLFVIHLYPVWRSSHLKSHYTQKVIQQTSV